MADIIERIKKLLALAKKADNENEAALAVERARVLMQQHNIAEAELRVSETSEPRAVEEIIEGQVTDTSKKVAWHMQIAGVVDELYGCHAFWRGGKIMFFGRLSAVQAATYTTQYLMAEVERFTNEQAPTSVYSRKFRNGFRYGCARRIRERLNEQMRKAKQAERRAEADAMHDEIQLRAKEAVERKHGQTISNASDMKVAEMSAEVEREARKIRRQILTDKIIGTEAPKVKASDGAIALLAKEAEEVKEAFDDLLYGKKNPKTGKRKRRGRTVNVGNFSSHSGYVSGKLAGDSVRLPGVARGALKRGTEVLK